MPVGRTKVVMGYPGTYMHSFSFVSTLGPGWFRYNAAEREKVRAIQNLYRRMEALQKKVYDMNAERNRIRETLGEERWRSNPSPKLTHSDKRKIFQQEIYEINSAINVIEPLFVNNFH